MNTHSLCRQSMSALGSGAHFWGWPPSSLSMAFVLMSLYLSLLSSHTGRSYWIGAHPVCICEDLISKQPHTQVPGGQRLWGILPSPTLGSCPSEATVGPLYQPSIFSCHLPGPVPLETSTHYWSFPALLRVSEGLGAQERWIHRNFQYLSSDTFRGSLAVGTMFLGLTRWLKSFLRPFILWTVFQNKKTFCCSCFAEMPLRA